MKTLKIKKTSIFALSLAILMSFTLMAPLGASAFSFNKANSTQPSIVDIVLKDDGEFDVLQAAVVRAGLVNALNGSGQYTVFAPTDAAFVKTLGVANEAEAIGAVNSLPIDQLTNILTYHVREGRLYSLAVLVRPGYKMLNGEVLSRKEVLNAGIAKVNVPAKNGVVHVINSVLLP
jgi:uncharacterized surface protein with fasciclin (FAS1) repeats